MNGVELASAVAARLASLPRTVYVHAVPSGPLPKRYLLVRTSEGSEDATRAVGTVSTQTPTVWVHSVSMHPAPEMAAREAAWGAGKVREALRNWRPQDRWAVTHEVSDVARRDESLPATTFVATEQFSFRSSA